MSQATSQPSDPQASRIANAWIDQPQRLNGPVTLHDPDPAWADLYQSEEERLRRTLGDRILLIEHVGSTSVPGLAAKPIIDIVLAVPDSSSETSYLPALEAAGYRLVIREPDWFEHRVLKGPDTNVNLHVFSQGTDELDRMIAFRDHLREHPADRILYENVKRQLAAREWKYIQDYADAKTQVITQIMQRAPNSRRTNSPPSNL